jgi:hypothetical protein
VSKAAEKAPEAEDTNNIPALAAAAGLPAEMMSDMMADAGMGVSTDPNEVGIPFLYILQDLSPQVKRRDEAYIEGAEVGDIYNNVTKEVIPAKVGFDWIEVGFEAAQVEWKPNRGGFVAKHPHTTPLVSDVRMMQDGDKMVAQLPSGNTLTETKYHYGLYRRAATADQPAGNWEPAVIGMASTMIKNSRELEGMKKRLRLPNNAIAPSFAVHYQFQTTLVSKNNNEWFVWKITQGTWVTSDEYRVAKDLATQVLAGTVKTAAPGDESASGGGAPSALDEEVL